ncbi:MAG: Caldesmon [Bacteroidetes bacterium MED-G17]|nr:MAG: Caldesmon [Bacteroidetes bacterium MED-G17]
MIDKKDIQCPNCGHAFSTNNVYLKQIEREIEEKYKTKVNQQAKDFAIKEANLIQEKEDFETKKKNENNLFQQKLKQKIQEERRAIEAESLEKFKLELSELKKENEAKKLENFTLKKKELDLQKKEQELLELKQEHEIEIERKILAKRQEMEQKIGEKLNNQFELERMQFQKQIDDQKKLTSEMQRKQEQGSMQMQGEVLELVLENKLRSLFPFDSIKEVPKGTRGADVIQVVRNHLQQTCGSILYESKRTKAFSNDWIDKLKEDQRMVRAEIAILVTETMPKEFSVFGKLNGIWVCSFSAFEGLSQAMRESLIKLRELQIAQENKGEKMEMLYKYLTGQEFKQSIERIVETFSKMNEQLDKEKRAMQKIWKEREKQIEKVMTSTIDMHSSFRGIAESIPQVKSLELGNEDEL